MVVSPKTVAYPYYLSCDVDLDICVKVRSFEFQRLSSHYTANQTNSRGNKAREANANNESTELYVSAQLVCQGEALHVAEILSHSSCASIVDINKVGS